MAKLTKLGLAGSSVIALASWQPAFAQAQGSGAEDNRGIQEIIVTAQKREQRLQDVPLAVTAVAGDTLQANRVQNVTDLTGLVPGLRARRNAGGIASANLAMRGVASAPGVPSQDGETSQYLDGVYIGGNRGVIFDIPDLERIEVLRGPQGTLFGRNATAGAVSIVTRDPTGELGFRQEVTVGNFDQLRTRTSVDLPAVGPFSAYVTYVHDERSGDVRNLGAGTTFDRTSPFTNVGLGRSPKTLGGKNFENIFAAVRFEPSSDFSMTYKFDNSDGTQTQEVRTVNALNTNTLIGGLLAQIMAAQPVGGGKYGPASLNPSDKRPNAFNNGWTQPGTLFVQGHNLTTKWQVSDNFALKNITAYRKSRVFAGATIAGLNGLEFNSAAADAYARFASISQFGAAFFSFPQAQQDAIIAGTRAFFQPQVGQFFGVYEGNNYGRGSQFSTEFQGNYNSKLLDLTAGVVYYQSKEVSSGLPGMAANFAFTPLAQLLPLGGIVDGRGRTKSYAAYAQADIHLTEKLDLQVGGRVTHDKKHTSLEQGGVFTGNRQTGTITGTTTALGNFSVTKPTYSIGLNYKASADTLLYAKTSTGFLSGGSVGVLTFEPETVNSQEVGIKTDLFDRHLRINLALWRAKYKHAQLSQSGATVGHQELPVVVVDAGNIKAKGVELEVIAQPFEGLTIGGQLGYTDKKLSNINPVFLIGQSEYLLGGTPTWIGGANAQYVTQPLFDQATMLFRIDGNYISKQRAITNPNVETAIPAFAPYEFSPSRWIVNARIALRDIPVGGQAKAEIGVWARNLTNNRDSQFPFPFGDFLFTDSYQSARTYGLDVIFKY